MKKFFFLVLGVMLLASCSDGIEGELKELCKKQDVYSVTCVISDKVSQSAHVYKFEDGRVWLSANMFDWTDCYMLNWRKRSIPTHSNGSIHSLLSPKIGLRSA